MESRTPHISEWPVIEIRSGMRRASSLSGAERDILESPGALEVDWHSSAATLGAARTEGAWSYTWSPVPAFSPVLLFEVSLVSSVSFVMASGAVCIASGSPIALSQLSAH